MDLRVTGDIIPDSNHISRLCHASKVFEGQIQPTAFHLRANDQGLSVNWLEFFNCSNREGEISEIRDTYERNFNSIGAGARIAVLNVGEVREIVLNESHDNRNLEVHHAPEEIDPSHSEIYHMNPDHEFIAELIIEVIQEEHPARKT